MLSWEPTKPVPPVISTRIGSLLQRSGGPCRQGSDAAGQGGDVMSGTVAARAGHCEGKPCGLWITGEASPGLAPPVPTRKG
jgi:hypothetical protein